LTVRLSFQGVLAGTKPPVIPSQSSRLSLEK
jgi:hypothetical protein